MDKHTDKSKKSTDICSIDTSDDESEGENPWRVWLHRVQAERARRSRDASAPAAPVASAPDLAAPGPSGYSSSHNQSASSPTKAERKEFWASISSGIPTNTGDDHRVSSQPPLTPWMKGDNAKEMFAALNKIMSSASKNAEKYRKYKEKFDAANRSMQDSARQTHSNSLLDNGSIQPQSFRVKPLSNRYSILDAYKAANKELESRTRKRSNSGTGTASHNPDNLDLSQPSTSGVKKSKHKSSCQHGQQAVTDRPSGSAVKHPRPASTTNSPGPTPHKVRKISSTETAQQKVERTAESDNLDMSLEDIELPSTAAPIPETIPESIIQTDVDVSTTLASNQDTVSATECQTKCTAESVSANSSTGQRASKAAQTVESVDLQLNQSLLSLLECPVCLECMEPPMVQCRRGHLVCRACSGRMPRCPVCRASFTSVRNRAMEQVAEKLRYPCRHTCGAVILLRLRARHEASCPQRNYACPLPACAELAPQPYATLMQHLRDGHPESVVFGSNHTFHVQMCTNQQKDWVVFVYDQIFHVHFATDSRNWGLNASVTYVGPKRNAKKYIYQISTTGSQNARKLVYLRETHSDLDVKSANYARGDAFFISIDHALNFIRPERHTLLPFDVAILANRGNDNQRDSAET